MNNEFMKLNDGTIEVIDEKGNALNRENNNIKEILIAENKVEIVDNKIENLNKKLYDYEKTVFLSKWMLISQPIGLTFISLCGFIRGALKVPSDFVIYGLAFALYSGFMSLIPISFASIYWSIINPVYKKKVKNTENELTKVKQLKEVYEKELAEEKDKNIDIVIEPLVKISLVEENKVIEEKITEELERNNINPKVKTRTRKR